jgi:lipopolysaccharide/colanic/teichoic acid biosynthesis glycosyltransferase
MIMNRVIKRAFDIILSFTGIILSSWLWALVWIAILLEDGSPAFITQKRVGKNGILFSSLKFRSMKKDSLKENVSFQALESDPRVTRVGRFMRKVALDEILQLLNILTGDLSFVGPRALLPREIEVHSLPCEIEIRHVPGYERRMTVQPGLTGIAQVFAHRDLPRRHKFKYDLLYIRKMNFLLDLYLIAVSFIVTFRGTWERRGVKLRFLNRPANRGRYA